jgi:hypothetical protein
VVVDISAGDSSSVDSAEEALDNGRGSSDECDSALVDAGASSGDTGTGTSSDVTLNDSTQESWDGADEQGGVERPESPGAVGADGGARRNSLLRTKTVRQNVIHYLHPQVSHNIGSDIPYYPPDRSTPGGNLANPSTPVPINVMEDALRSVDYICNKLKQKKEVLAI